jgi:hypothetical protein
LIEVPETLSAFRRRAHVAARPLRDQTHRELVYRPLQFHERGQDFIGAHDEPLSVRDPRQ